MVNQVVLIGRITRDIEMKMTSSGREVCNFSIAVNRNYKNPQGEYDADFINCVAFGQTAKFMSQYLEKGRLISVTGRIQTRNYENNMGQRVYVTEIIADNVSGLEGRRDSTSQNSTNTFNNQPQENSPYDFVSKEPSVDSQIMDDDLPF